MEIQLTRTQAKHYRKLAKKNKTLRRTIASAPSTHTYLQLRFSNEQQIQSARKAFETLIDELLTEDATGPECKMAYALQRHIDRLQEAL